MDDAASLSTRERLALLCEHDDAAFVWVDPTAPAWHVGHFAVVKMPSGLIHSNATRPMLPWVVTYPPSRTVCLDFATEDRAWQFADEISTACGDRLGSFDPEGDDEPAVPTTPQAFMAAVPDVIAWVRALASIGVCPQGHERPFMRFRPWLHAKQNGLRVAVLDPPRGAIGMDHQWEQRA